MKQGPWTSRTSSWTVVGLLALAGVLIAAGPSAAQAPADCPLPAGSGPVEPLRVTARQVEDGSASLADFATEARSRASEQARLATTPDQALYFACRVRQPDGIWRAGSTYLVALTPDGRVYVHAGDMSLAGRLLKVPIHGAILQALGIDPAVLSDYGMAFAAFRAAAQGDGGYFAVPDVPGASGYANLHLSPYTGLPTILVAGFDLKAEHLADEELDYGNPTITARDVVDRASLKSFVTQAGEYFPEILKQDYASGSTAASSKARIARRDPNGPWRHGSVYLYVLNTATDVITFHAAFPDLYELRPLRPTRRDVVTGELILPQVIAAAKSSPEGGFAFNLDAMRREAANGDDPPEHGVMLRSLIRW